MATGLLAGRAGIVGGIWPDDCWIGGVIIADSEALLWLASASAFANACTLSKRVLGSFAKAVRTTCSTSDDNPGTLLPMVAVVLSCV